MRIPIALLADFALAHQDGKFYITGGGIERLSFPTFPGVQPRLSIALRVEIPPEQIGAPHTLRIQAVGPDKSELFEPVSFSFVAAPPEYADAPATFQFVYNMENISFPQEGTYLFGIAVDDRQMVNLPLRVRRMPGPLPADQEPYRKLVEGYQAFGRGEVDAALEIFRDVAARFPNIAMAHNNLGFVLLGQGQAALAQEAFTKARELAFLQPEILDANMACAQYQSGDPTSALTAFEQCLRVRGFRGEAVLYGIAGSKLFAVPLHSASDYVAVMMLNAGWSALAAGDRAKAARYLEGAEAAELRRRGDESGETFGLSIDGLNAQLA